MEKKEWVLVGLIIVLIGASTLFFGGRKYSYHVDEIWNYGLANHEGGIVPDIEYGKTYKGLGVYKDFVNVEKDERFDYVNVWKNQEDDVHPPLYYCVFHTVCSLFPDSFSPWFGIGVNLFWMVFIIILLYKLARAITGNTVEALGIILVYGTTVVFFDSLLFIRMYTQFTFFTVALSYLLQQYWEKKIDKKFYGLFATTIILGLLTHYYFMIFAFALCGAFAVHLIMDKRIYELRGCVITALCSGMFYLLIWHHILRHIFRRERGIQSLKSAVSIDGILDGPLEMFRNMDDEAFAGYMFIVAIAMLVVFVKKLKKKKVKYTFSGALLISGVFYMLLVGKIAPYTDVRYVMPVMFIFSLLAFTFMADFIQLLLNLYERRKGKIVKASVAVYIAGALFIVVNILNVTYRNFYLPMDFYDQQKEEYKEGIKGKKCVGYIEVDWESLCMFESFSKAESYMFLNKDSLDKLKDIKKDYLIVTTSPHVEEVLEQVKGEVEYSAGDLCCIKILN